YFGPNAPVAVIREATKLHQEVLRGTAAELSEKYGKKSWKGECVVVIGSADGAVEEYEEPAE
ncbi:MAG: 16S rRNA (cytidine(1402)-2'-O)-methyltransferase, partial [Lentisphaeria bacterium]|nr:16S rRNA (cytidine(1402)-2'-O)-methyltransferase [Lentisphaeria bacterium]